jgi:hypothetical protein
VAGLRVLVVVGDMRPTAQEVGESDLIIKVPIGGNPQVIYWDGPREDKPVVARSHRSKPARWAQD